MTHKIRLTRSQLEVRLTRGDAWPTGGETFQTHTYDREAEEVVAADVEIIEDSPWLDAWLRLGRENHWIRAASDPPFARDQFVPVGSVEELEARLLECNWTVGAAFYLGPVCFVNQSESSDEWLVIKESTAFESFSIRQMIREGAFRPAVDGIMRSTVEQCRRLQYEGDDEKDDDSGCIAVEPLPFGDRRPTA